MTAEISQEPLHCTQCESLGEISFSRIQRQQEDKCVRIWVKNLPDGITESGVKNLFLTVGKPLSINYYPRTNSALVLLKSMNEADLALRDLDCKPPYDLRVTLVTPRFQNEFPKERGNESEGNELWDFSQKETPVESNAENDSEKISEVPSQLQNFIENLGYDPSIRMRQRKLDFKTDLECVFMGRGYMYMGTNDRFIGGLQHFVSSSQNSKAKDKGKFFCEICKALTTKICGKCSAPFCSKVCLSNSNINHHKNCSDFRNNEVLVKTECGDQFSCDLDQQSSASVSSDRSLSQIPLKTGCTVVISTYFTMNTVFVRCSDDPWEEKFTNLCNDVAAEVLKGENLAETPKQGDFVIAKYYEDLCFYRAQVRSNNEGRILLFFFDFGNTQETKLEDLKPLPDYLKSTPGFAVKIHLKDVSEGSSLDSVNYFNKLTAEKTPLILKFENSTDSAVLIEKDSKVEVNKTVNRYVLPSWRKDDFVLSKLGEVFYLNSIEPQNLEEKKTCNLKISHFDKKEFLESEVFWVTDPESDNFLHANSEMYLRIREYCQLLKDDCYLPRINELCLAKENGEWRRCVNLKSHKNICCLFFIDDGHSSFIETQNIRKMIEEFTETPSQAICCTLPDNPKLKSNQELQSKVIEYLKESCGQIIYNVCVLKLMGDAYCLSIPEINKILA